VFSEIRRKVVLQDFIEALTQGENALSARAIDIQAHDPLRYLGDILAWTHQAVAGEKEILTLIFGVAANSRQSQLEPGNERWLEDGTILSAFDDLIEKDLEGTCRPMRVRSRSIQCVNAQSRIEHLITSQENPTLLFRISMLLKFYRHTLTRMLNDLAQLVIIITKHLPLCPNLMQIA
jgi:conserved oligomeric Golgi complex subunit 6